MAVMAHGATHDSVRRKRFSLCLPAWVKGFEWTGLPGHEGISPMYSNAPTGRYVPLRSPCKLFILIEFTVIYRRGGSGLQGHLKSRPAVKVFLDSTAIQRFRAEGVRASSIGEAQI